MSKLSHQLTTVTETGRKVKRTIDHSPEFGEDSTEGDSPTGRIPPGGFLTG
ncbi:hypothetical protein [Halopiger goleimassiliensis]|uniref:hypothetical protein n=1 Tax=Halopiger goleimassiliensis TaxID=1293048 RepID=UPI0018A81420|nr:hypothetical protein [Halopiger goleimassiliensis]